VPSPARGLTQPQRLEISGHRLIEAAAELIVEKGWEATTAAEIGRRAGYSRAMVHARFGSKDAILDTLFRDEYTKKLSPTPDPEAPGLTQALAHFDRITELLADDRNFLRAMFVLGFEAVKKTSPLRRRMRAWLTRGTETVEAGLRLGIGDGSVRTDIDVDRAANDISAVVFGLAYQWIVLADRYDLGRELAHARERIIADYGSGAGR
jgi:AcrR family transcriptional regulator